MKEDGKYYPVENGLIPLKGGKWCEHDFKAEERRDGYRHNLIAAMLEPCAMEYNPTPNLPLGKGKEELKES